MHRSIAILSLTLILAACGFTPLHGRQHSAEATVNLSEVAVSVAGTALTTNAPQTLPRRYGELLTAEIEDQTNPDAFRTQKRFHLRINYTEEQVGLFVNPDGTASRGNLIFSSTYTVTRLADGKVVAKGGLQNTSSYSTSPTADYASYVSVEDARKRGILALAQSYKLRMAALLPTLNDPNAAAVESDAAQSAPPLQPVHSYETLR